MRKRELFDALSTPDRRLKPRNQQPPEGDISGVSRADLFAFLHSLEQFGIVFVFKEERVLISCILGPSGSIRRRHFPLSSESAGPPGRRLC